MAGDGYLLIDNRETPGSPGVPGGAVFEAATRCCAHCNRVVVLNPLRTRARGCCQNCAAYVCDSPACGLDCRPFKKLLDEFKGG